MLRSRLLRLRGCKIVCGPTHTLFAPRPPTADFDDDEDIFADLKDDEEDDRASYSHKQPLSRPLSNPPPTTQPKPSLLPTASNAKMFRFTLPGSSPPQSGRTYPRPSYLDSSSGITTHKGNTNPTLMCKKGLPYEETTFDDEWKCPACTKANFLNRSSCRSCGTLKPMSLNSSTSQQRAIKPPPQLRFLDDSEDLLLPTYEEEDDVEQQHQGGIRYIPSPRGDTTSRRGDWKCPSCSTLNFARRITCFACAAPKPLLPPGETSSDGDPISAASSKDAWKNRSLLGRSRAIVTPSTTNTAVEEDNTFPEDEFYEAQLAAHWVCDDCAMVNGSSRTTCVGCSKLYNKVGTRDGDEVISGLGGLSSSSSPSSGKKRSYPAQSSPPPTPSRRQLLESILAEEEGEDEARRVASRGQQGGVDEVFGDSLWADEGDSQLSGPPHLPPTEEATRRGPSVKHNETTPDGRPVVDLDWACPSCKYTNFRARNTCRQCNELKPTEIARVQRRVAEEAGLRFRGATVAPSASSPSIDIYSDLDRNATVAVPAIVDRSLSVPPTAPPNCQRFFRDGNPRDPLSLFSYNSSTRTNAKETEGLRSVIAGRSIPTHLLGSIPLHKRFGDPSTGYFDILLMSPHPKPHRLNLGDWQCNCGVVNRASRSKCLGCGSVILKLAAPPPTSIALASQDAGTATSSSCTAVVVVGLAEQMTLVRTQRLVRKGVLTLERASHLFMPKVLSYLEPAWFCGPCGMLVGPTEIRSCNRLKLDSKTPKPVCPHCNTQRLGRKGSHVWMPTFPEMPRSGQRCKIDEALSSKGGIPVGPAFVAAGEDYTGHNLPEVTLNNMKLSIGSVHPGDWVCKKCSWYNFRDQTKCRRCQGGRAVSVLSLMVEGGKLGDWVCGNCLRFNYHRLETCFGCYPPLKDGEQLEGTEPSMMKGSAAPSGAGIQDVDAGSAFLRRSEMDKVQLSEFQVERAIDAGGTASGPTTTPPKRKPFTGTRQHALVILGEDLTPEVVQKNLPSPPKEVDGVTSFPSPVDLVDNLEIANSVIAQVYSKMGVCPECNYRHHVLDVLPGSRCKECHTELTVKLYPFIEGPPFSVEGGDTKPMKASDGSDTVDELTAPPAVMRRYIKSCRACNTENHTSRDICRRCGLHLSGWRCEADAVDDEEGLFEEGVEPPVTANTVVDSDGRNKRICGHVNPDDKAYCTKCGAYAPNAVMPTLDHDKFRRSFGSRLHAQTHQSDDWLSRKGKHSKE